MPRLTTLAALLVACAGATSPTISPTPPPQLNSSSALKQLTNVASGPSEVPEAFPLGECQGDCDNDDECQGTLVCMHCDGGEIVPGCNGTDTTRTDYCVVAPPPTSSPSLAPSVSAIPTISRSPSASPTISTNPTTSMSPSTEFLPLTFVARNYIKGVYPLGRCEGDCDKDSECAGSLICYQRDGGDPVPGCVGTDTSSRDYCVSLKEMCKESEQETRWKKFQPDEEGYHSSPSSSSIQSPTLQQTFLRGDLAVDVKSLGIKICTGMQVKVLTKANETVVFQNG